MTTVFDTSIVGGGVVGLTVALGMGRRGFRLAVIDPGSLTIATDKADLKVFAINHASIELFKSLGVWPLLSKNAHESRLSPYQHMTIWDRGSRGSIEFDARMIAKDMLGFIVEESVIRAAVLHALSQLDNVVLFPKQTIDTLSEEGGLIQLASKKKRWTTRFLLAADGANSPCRALLKVPVTTWAYDQHALVATVMTELPHNQTAYQVFNPDGPLAFLPLINPHQCSIVWSTTPARAKELVSASKKLFNQGVTTAFSSKLGKVAVISPRHQFPLVMRHVQQYAGANWVLLGDAAHTIHPLAGLGLNLGLSDVAEWFSLLDKTPGCLPLKKHLAAYQRQRKHAVWQVILLMQSLKTLFSSTLAPIRFLRGVGLQCCDELPLLKRLFIDYADG